ncbi:hypothetical protein [Sporosarcina jiandibaonis]|uniref:hypothetical protein n=1 Tax=Sporosarcina jiandibaonis TaxID=2715535 RepID=UPI001555460A|nr:hypothetical protein [Sporosarcina jiandibaonis]
MSMNLEESRRMAIKMPELRKKELRTKLTIAEQQELDQMLAIKAERYPENTEVQYAENVRLTAIKNITYRDVTRKESLFQKLLKQENAKEYRIQIMNEEEDLAEYTFHFTFALEIRQLMEDVGLGLEWPKMLPVDDQMCYTDPLDEEDKEWFEAFPDPSWCFSKLQEARNLEENAAIYGEEMIRVINWLKMHWKKGYRIYADIDPVEYDEWV